MIPWIQRKKILSKYQINVKNKKITARKEEIGNMNKKLHILWKNDEYMLVI